MHPVGIAGFDLRGAAGAVVGDRRVIGAKRRSGAICPTVVPPRRRGGGRSFRRSAGFFVGRAGGSDAKCCWPSCRWKKASLIRWGGRRPQAAAQPRTAHQRRSAVSGMCTAPTFPGAWTLRGTIDYPKTYPDDLRQHLERLDFL